MAVGQYVFYGKPFIGRSPGANGAANTLAALIPLPAALTSANTCPCAGWSMAAGAKNPKNSAKKLYVVGVSSYCAGRAVENSLYVEQLRIRCK